MEFRWDHLTESCSDHWKAQRTVLSSKMANHSVHTPSKGGWIRSVKMLEMTMELMTDLSTAQHLARCSVPKKGYTMDELKATPKDSGSAPKKAQSSGLYSMSQ